MAFSLVKICDEMMLSSLCLPSLADIMRSNERSSAMILIIFCSSSFWVRSSSLFCFVRSSSSRSAFEAFVSRTEIWPFKFVISPLMPRSFFSPFMISPAKSSSFLLSCSLIACVDLSEFLESFIFSLVFDAKARLNASKSVKIPFFISCFF